MSDSFLFIPDVTGFTKFVNQTAVEHSRHIMSELLELLIDADQLGMEVAEIEGDAVFFVRRDSIPSVEDVIEQARVMFLRFHSHLKTYDSRRICNCGACTAAVDLSLKAIAHAGLVESLTVRGATKVHGPPVITVHRLLKNDIPEREYLLLTRDLQDRGPSTDLTALAPWIQLHLGRATYDDMRAVDFEYVPLAPLLTQVPDPPPRPEPLYTATPAVFEGHIDRAADELFEIVCNLDLRMSWNTTVEDFLHEAGRVNRAGTRHNCVVDGDLLEFETVTRDLGEGVRVYGERLENPPLVRRSVLYWIVTEEEDGSRLRLEAHYEPRSFPARFLAFLFRRFMARTLPGIFARIRSVAQERTERAV